MSTEKKIIKRPGEFVSTPEGGYYRIYDPESRILTDVPLTDFKRYEPVFQTLPKLTEDSIKLHISEVPEVINKILREIEKELTQLPSNTVFKSYRYDREDRSFVYVAIGPDETSGKPFILFSRRSENSQWKISKILVFQSTKEVFDYEQIGECVQTTFTRDELARMLTRFARDRGIRYVCGFIRHSESKADSHQKRLMA